MLRRKKSESFVLKVSYQESVILRVALDDYQETALENETYNKAKEAAALEASIRSQIRAQL